jgi:choline-sulfatase
MSNVILLMTDEHNPKYSSLYGGKAVHTPNMQRLANRGTLYRQAYCLSPICLPSRSAFLTGKRVHQLQTYTNCRIGLHPAPPTYGDALANQGVHTIMIGKMPPYYGESFSEEHLSHDRLALDAVKPLKRSSAATNQIPDSERGIPQTGIVSKAFDGDTAKINFAADWLKNIGSQMKQEFVMTVCLQSPHPPMVSTAEYWEMYNDNLHLPDRTVDTEAAQHAVVRQYRLTEGITHLNDRQFADYVRGYYAKISFVDYQLGRLMDTLEELGMSDSTNLIYTSDHGEMLGKFGLVGKRALYEDSVRIPCIAAGPDFPAGKVVDTPVDLTDVQASLFAATGRRRPAEMLGQPLQSIANNDENRVIFSEFHGAGTNFGTYMIRKGDWKLVYYVNADCQLFHLREDPDELHNVYEQNPDKVRELEADLHSICSPELEDERAHSFQARQFELMEQGNF